MTGSTCSLGILLARKNSLCSLSHNTNSFLLVQFEPVLPLRRQRHSGSIHKHPVSHSRDEIWRVTASKYLARQRDIPLHEPPCSHSEISSVHMAPIAAAGVMGCSHAAIACAMLMHWHTIVAHMHSNSVDPRGCRWAGTKIPRYYLYRSLVLSVFIAIGRIPFQHLSRRG